MVFEKATTFFGKVRKGLDEKGVDIAKFAVKEAAGAIPVVGQIIKDAFDEFSPDEKEELIKELTKLSESQFKEIKEISAKMDVSVEYLKDIREITLYSFEELRADHGEIIKKEEVIEKRTEKIEGLLLHLIEIQTREVKPPEIDLPIFEYVLEKENQELEGDFFRTEPKWIDFEEGFIVERKEVDEIINKLESNNIQLVLGAPASGKSVILKNIGFKLAKKGDRVYIIQLKKLSAGSIESYFTEARKINDERTLIIVDDAHLELSKCEELLSDFRYNKVRTKLIIGTREVKELEEKLKEKRKIDSEFKKLTQTKICATDDVSEKMISLYLKERHHLSDEDRIKTVSKEFVDYKHDLWDLSCTLDAYDPNTDTVRIEEVYSYISHECITNIYVSADKNINGKDIFLPLSFFFRFEIPIEKRFLTTTLAKTLEIDTGCIKDLIDISEIHEFKKRGITMLAMYHSSLASLYFKTYQSIECREFMEDITERITEQSKHDDWIRGLFYLYLRSEPINALEVLIRLADNLKQINGGKTLFEELIEDTEIEKSIKKGVENEEDIDAIGLCVSNIAGVNKEIALKLIDSFSSKIDKEEDIWKIESCLGSISSGNKKVAEEVAEHIDPPTLASKINEEEVSWKIASYLSHLSDVSEELAQKVTKYINIDNYVSKVDKEEDIERAASLVIASAQLSKEIALESVDSFSSKIDKEEDWVKIGLCVSNIAEVSKEVALKLIERIEDIEKIDRCVMIISSENEEVAQEIVNCFDIDTFSSKIDKEEDIRKIGSLMVTITQLSEKAALRLVDSISSRIDKEEDIEKIGWFVSNNFGRLSGEVAHKIVNCIDIDKFVSKIDKEEHMGKIRSCVTNIAEVNKELALKLVDGVSSKIEDIQKIGWCVNIISARLSEEEAQGIVSRLNPGIREELQKGGFIRKVKGE